MARSVFIGLCPGQPLPPSSEKAPFFASSDTLAAGGDELLRAR